MMYRNTYSVNTAPYTPSPQFFILFHFLFTLLDPPMICGAGFWSSNGSISCQPCNHGYQCPAGSTTPTPSDTQCPQGAWCDGANMYLCPMGTYGNITGAISQTHGCYPCPVGYTCPVEGLTDYMAYPCLPGYYCPPATPSETEHPCPAGTFNPNSSVGYLEAACLLCEEGFYCDEGSSAGVICPAGFFCPNGTPSSDHHPCPIGTYGNLSGLVSADQCVECPAGHYCPQGRRDEPTTAPLPCKPGTYNPYNGTGHEFNCLLCPAGMSCPMYAQVSANLSCNQGHYCPNGTIQPNQYACPPGTYSFSYDLTKPEECSICPAGRACSWATGFNFSEPQFCAQGHFCPAGTPSPLSFPCPPGTYSNSSDLTSAAECDVCPEGHYCVGGESGPHAACPPGFYCPMGTRFAEEFPCPQSTYNPLFGQASTDSCLNCTQGHFCEKGFSQPEACPEGTYMPYGVSSIITMDTVGDPAGNKSECLSCPAGKFCSAATVTPRQCGVGKYSPGGSESCLMCLAGHYCNDNCTSETSMLINKQCPPGNYCTSGLTSVDDSVPCSAGFYCPRGTVVCIIDTVAYIVQ